MELIGGHIMSKTIVSADADVELTITSPKQQERITEYSHGKRFAFQAIRSLGFTPMACISEFIDNSIDAGANNIHLTWERNDKDSPYSLVIEDDGKAVPKNKMFDCFTKLGNDEDYDSSRVGHFGVGVKAAFINLMKEGKASVVSRDGKDVSTLNILHEDDQVEGILSHKPCKTKDTGIILNVNNIDTQLSEQQIIKTCSVMYYPNYIRNKEAGIKFTLTVNGKEVKFIDPMYRGKSYDGLDSHKESFTFLEEPVRVEVLSFMPKFDWDNCSKWDHDKGKPSLKPSNSGIYLRLGGRYISLGQSMFPGVTYQTVLQNLRMEITLDKDLLEEFGVQVNKSKLEFDLTDGSLTDFKRVIKNICSAHIRKYNAARGKKIDGGEVKSLDSATRALNRVLKTSGKEKPIVAQVGDLIEKREFKGRNPYNKGVEPKNTGRTRSGNRKKITKTVDFVFLSNGFGPMYEWSKSNGTLVIALNRDHKWVETFASSEWRDMVPVLWKIYSWIHAGYKVAQELEDSHEYIMDMHNLVANESQFLNKWLSNK